MTAPQYWATNFLWRPVWMRECHGISDGLADHPCDPLDVKYDGVMLRVLLERDQFNRCDLAQRDPESEATQFAFTPTQRAAVSAHWSAKLRTRVAEAKAKERECVVLDMEVDNL